MSPRAKPLSPTELKAIFSQLGRRPSRVLGQNFLIDQRVVEQFLAVAAPLKGAIIVEVGAGLGAVTETLVGYGNPVIAIEKDPLLANQLQTQLMAWPNLRVIAADILTLAERALPSQPYALVASLPYSITTPFLKRFLLDLKRRPQALTLILQTEAAERVAAEPLASLKHRRSGPAMNALAFLCQSQSQVKLGVKISPAAFWPQPKVGSRIIKLTPLKPADQKTIQRVSQAFRWPRKTLLAITAKLAPRVPKSRLAAEFLKAGLKPTARPAELSVSQWQAWATLF